MTFPLNDSRFDRALLEAYHFDAEYWQNQVDALKSGRNPGGETIIRGHIEAPTNVPELTNHGTSQALALEAGISALSRGEVACLILNGGLATRFGGVVKGIVEVFDGKSFLALKAEDVRRAADIYQAPVPVVVLNSFSTKQLTLEHFEEQGYFGLRREDVWFMDQTVSVRLDENYEPFFGLDGEPRYYAPGHGEFFDVLLQSGVRDALLKRGVKYLTFSNVDNLGATIDPTIIGRHILSRVDMTVEVVEKRKNALGQYDVGGSPIVLDGRLVVVEGFRFPASLQQDSLRDFQTNNMLFSLSALGQPMNLPRYLVKKVVDGKSSIAFEAITCEASGKQRPDGSMALSLGLLRVPREGTFGRFFPVKSRQDLEEVRTCLKERLEGGWSARIQQTKALIAR
jgi:UTP--glucose-1-phosphate uridylyltransferase